MENFERQFNQPKSPEETKNPEPKQETPPVSESSQSPPENLNKSTESTTENQEKVESQEKNLKLEEIRHDVESISDRLGKPIEEGIKETVVMFKANGLPTSDSCEGHVERGLPVPYVEVSAPNEPEERFVGQNEAFEKVAKKYNITPDEARTSKIDEAYWEAMKECSQNEETEEYKKWNKENEKLLAKAHNLLEEFYKERQVEPDVKLQIEEGVGNFRIHNGGEDYQPVIEEEREFTEEEKRIRAEKLEKYRAEMKGFTEFLKEKYLKENPARHNPETKTEKKKTSSGLYDVKEVEGGFEVVFPGLFDKKREAIFGTSKQRFETREEAEQAAERAKESAKVQFERASLEKTFTKYFYRIDETPDGKFQVVLPGLLDSKTGYYVGTTHKEFGTWDEAREYYLSQRENEEKLTQKPLLEIKTSENEKIAFSDLDSFNPRVAPSEKSYEIPASIEKYLLGKEKLAADAEHGPSTYQETIKEKGWETKLFDFVSSYFKKEGAKVAKELKIENLDALTPKQAIELATQIVIDLTKYKKSDAQKEIERKPGEKLEKTKADQSTVLQLLQEGLKKRNQSGWDEKNPIWEEWEGNGVCRNFASSVKAVFEALKANQTRFNQLRNTYCLYESGAETFAPKRERKNVLELSKTGHAWNTFVTVSKEGAANAVIIDATWAKRNLETKKIEGLDYTLTRMEPVVHAIGQGLQETAPDKEEQLKHIMSFYMLKMEKPGDTGGFASPEEEKQFYATRALELMAEQGVPRELPKPLVEAIGQEYLKIADDADRSEIETIYKISQSNPDLDFRNIFRNYLKDKELSNYHADSLIFRDDNLQRAAFEELKLRKDFYNFLKESPKFKVRMRECLPQLFIGFSPATKPEDAAELKYLVGSQRMLKRYEYMIDPRKPSEEKIRSFFEKARQSLRAINPQKYDESFARFDDYQLVKQFDRIDREIRT